MRVNKLCPCDPRRQPEEPFSPSFSPPSRSGSPPRWRRRPSTTTSRSSPAWVSLLPPYNEHLVTDVGGLYLGFAVLFAWAARTLERALVHAVCAAWLLTATLHLIFHVGHLEGFGTADAIAEIASLALLLAPPAVAIWGVAPPDST